MTRHRYGLLALLAAVALLVLPATLLAQSMILEAEGIPTRADWTPDCSNWHELYPNFCANHHQDSHEDNGDAEISVCDFITLDGLRFHIDWVGPTYWLDCDNDGFEDIIFEPIEWWPGDPYCQEWVQVWPEYGSVFHVDGWEDANMSGEVDECDFVQVGPDFYCHVLYVGLNIHTTEDPTPVEDSSWSKVKSFFNDLF